MTWGMFKVRQSRNLNKSFLCTVQVRAISWYCLVLLKPYRCALRGGGRRKGWGWGVAKKTQAEEKRQGGRKNEHRQGTEGAQNSLRRRQRGNVRNRPQWMEMGSQLHTIPELSQFNCSNWGNLIMPFMSTRRNMFGQSKNRRDVQEKTCLKELD